MLGSSMFRGLEEDPFFASHREHMRRMDSMFADPFGMMMGPGIHQQQRGRAIEGSRAVQPRAERNPMGLMDPMGMFGSFNDMFSNMRNSMQMMEKSFESVRSDPNTHSFQQTAFMSYSNVPGQGQPKMFQSSSSTRVAPGGVRETKKTLRDSESGLEKMAIGHHINERGHVMERSRNHKTGQQDQNEELINLDEDDRHRFDAEWQEKTRQTNRNRLDYARRGERYDGGHRHERERHGGGRHAAIESPRDHIPREHRPQRPRYRDRE